MGRRVILLFFIWQQLAYEIVLIEAQKWHVIIYALLLTRLLPLIFRVKAWLMGLLVEELVAFRW